MIVTRILLFPFVCFTIAGWIPGDLASAGPITTLTIREKAGQTTVNFPLTFGHVFKQGDVPQGIAVQIDGQLLPTQFDVKTRYDDNSVRHGVISVYLPIIQANEDLNIALVNAETNASAGFLGKSAIQATGVQSRIALTSISGSGYSGALTADLQQAIDDSAPGLMYWLAGPVVTEILVQQQLNSSLAANWEVRLYPGWNGIRVSNAIENVEGDYRGNIDYSVDILMGDAGTPLSSRYTKSSFQHNRNARWRKVFWIGQEPPEIEIRYDIGYLVESKHILNYDTSITIPESTIASRYSSWLDTDRDIMGTGYVQTYFPTTGDREEIGQLPTWTVRYLLSMDNRLKEIMLNHAEMASGIPIHYRESNPEKSFYGRIISLDDRPTVWLGREDFQYQDEEDRLPDPVGSEDTVWHVDRSHQTSFAYIPYLVTGERYYLEELYYWSAYDLAASNHEYRERELGLIRDQVRGEAWAIRVLAQTAAIAPDGEPEKDYITRKVINNINEWRSEISDPDHHQLHTWGYISCWGEDGGRPIDTIIGCEGTDSRTGTGSGVNEEVYPVRHISTPWQDDWMILSLCHMKELGFDTQDILAWLGEYAINRFTHPDASWYNGADYRYPATYVENVASSTPYFAIPAWQQVSDSIIEKSTEMGSDNPTSYARKAFAGLSCVNDIGVRQISSDGSVDRYLLGQRAYTWLDDQFDNNDVWLLNPTWAIIPRFQIDPLCSEHYSTIDNRAYCHGDINQDWKIDLLDSIILLQFVSGHDVDVPAGITGIDVNNDGHVGLEEALFVIQHAADM